MSNKIKSIMNTIEYLNTIEITMTLENAANIRVMGTDTLEGMKTIDKDIEERITQVVNKELTLDQAVKLIKEG